jgi:hypothetical protein
MEDRQAMTPLSFCCTTKSKILLALVVGRCWLSCPLIHRVNHHLINPWRYSFCCILFECMLLHCTHMGVAVERDLFLILGLISFLHHSNRIQQKL